MARRPSERWRCLIVGCNPRLKNAGSAQNHKAQTGHRVARWPVRSAEGKRRQVDRNRERLISLIGEDAFYGTHEGEDDHNKGPDGT